MLYMFNRTIDSSKFVVGTPIDVCLYWKWTLVLPRSFRGKMIDSTGFSRVMITTQHGFVNQLT